MLTYLTAIWRAVKPLSPFMSISAPLSNKTLTSFAWSHRAAWCSNEKPSLSLADSISLSIIPVPCRPCNAMSKMLVPFPRDNIFSMWCSFSPFSFLPDVDSSMPVSSLSRGFTAFLPCEVPFNAPDGLSGIKTNIIYKWNRVTITSLAYSALKQRKHQVRENKKQKKLFARTVCQLKIYNVVQLCLPYSYPFN